MYDIKGKNFEGFQSYLANRKQFINYRDQDTNLEVLRCALPQVSKLEPLVFPIFVNDLKKSTKLLDPIVFADGTNLFYINNKKIKVSTETVDKELQLFNKWFIANKHLLMQETLNIYYFMKKAHVIVFH